MESKGNSIITAIVLFLVFTPIVTFAESDLDYQIIGGSVLDVVTDNNTNSLIFTIYSTSDGQLTVTIPRHVLDARFANFDDDFFVIVDGDEVDYDETTTSTARTLYIAFPHRAQSIEIIGSILNSPTSSPNIPPISVSTDLEKYANGDSVIITGNIRDFDSSSGYGLTWFIQSPDNEDVAIGQLTPSSDGSFQITIVAGGPLWELSGDYVIEFNYGSDSGKTIIVYTGGDAPVGIQNSITVTTDKASYSEGETILVTGKVRDLYSGTPASIIVKAPNGDLVSIVQVTVSVGKKFSTEMTAGGALMDIAGTYTVIAQYGIASRSAETTFLFEGSTPYPSPTYDTTPPKILKPTDIIVDAENQYGARVFYDVLAIDETDQIVQPSCNPSSGSLFEVGETRIICNARDSSGNRATPISFYVTVNSPEVLIPNWVKEVAAFWCNDTINDESFIEAVQYLIENGVILVPLNYNSSAGTGQIIPDWVKNNACWWSEDLISDDDFASGLEYLVQQGIIKV